MPCHWKIAALAGALSAAILLAACGSDDKSVGGDCRYADIMGTCTVTSISGANAGANNCGNDPVEVLFTFAPLSGSTAGYLFPTTPDTGRTLTVGDGRNPPRTCVSGLGLDVASVLPCTRREETAGACTPVVFTLDSVDFSGCSCL